MNDKKYLENRGVIEIKVCHLLYHTQANFNYIPPSRNSILCLSWLEKPCQRCWFCGFFFKTKSSDLKLYWNKMTSCSQPYLFSFLGEKEKRIPTKWKCWFDILEQSVSGLGWTLKNSFILVYVEFGLKCFKWMTPSFSNFFFCRKSLNAKLATILFVIFTF